jgi:hypothetical protein
MLLSVIGVEEPAGLRFVESIETLDILWLYCIRLGFHLAVNMLGREEHRY